MTNAEMKLKEFADSAYPFEVHKIHDRLYHIVGLSHSNATVVIADSSVILIDSLDSDARALRLREMIKEWSDYPVKTIIYTHSHPDHRGGGGAFRDIATRVIQSSSRKAVLKHMEKLSDQLMKRAIYQFGYKLSDDELITQGLGIREGMHCNDGKYDFLTPTEIFTDEFVELNIDGVKIQLVSAPGETDDQMFCYFPDFEVMCSGDNFYNAFPNLYAIRGSQYRDVASWIDSLRKMLNYKTNTLCMGHGQPIVGYDAITTSISNYANALESILLQTLECINSGMSELETVNKVKLPDEYKNLSYLQEFYGKVSWGVRSIYHGYLGWFDGNPTNLNPLNECEYAKVLLNLISEDKLLKEIETAVSKEEYQKALQLCDILIKADIDSAKAKEYKKTALLGIARTDMNSNARHYYIASAKDM